MATRKQRRRREKEQRHEYEVVYLDSEGNEVEPDEVAPPKDAKRTSGSATKSKSSTSRGRSTTARRVREPQPPSWQRAIRRGAIFLPLFIAFVLLTNRKNANPQGIMFISLVFAVLIIPFTYFTDRLMWRIYQRRTSGGAPKR